MTIPDDVRQIPLSPTDAAFIGYQAWAAGAADPMRSLGIPAEIINDDRYSSHRGNALVPLAQWLLAQESR